jgi:2-dehydropantoate 2-reductase
MIKQHHRWIESLLPPCTWHTNIVAALWQKLAINAVINPLTAINNIYNGELTEPHYRQQIQNLSEEISVVMTALGIPISATSVLNNCLQVAKATAANYSSMHQDIANRRRTEIDFINGHVVSEGARLGVSVTHHQLIWRQIKKMEAQPPFNHD